MNTLHFTIDINAPKEKVWEVMLADETYREWTSAFQEGSRYEGSWDKGSKIRFIGPDKEGKIGGMFGRIAENRPYEYISIEYGGEIVDDQEDSTSDHVKQWIGAHENYTFSESDGVTTLAVELEGVESPEMITMFEEAWPKALGKLKAIAER